jgi:nucleotide-binding universal stress UspA family protein
MFAPSPPLIRGKCPDASKPCPRRHPFLIVAATDVAADPRLVRIIWDAVPSNAIAASDQPFALLTNPPRDTTEFVLAGATLEDMRRQQTSEAEGLTARAAATAKAASLTTETVVREGDPRLSTRRWIVVGSHGRTGLKRWLLGSVAQAVVGHAPFPSTSSGDERPR